MGLWDAIFGSCEEQYDRYERKAHRDVEYARKLIRCKYGDNSDITRQKEAEALKEHVKCVNEQGGLEKHKYALAGWQIFKALYPEWITDADRPNFVSKCWDDRHLH